MVILNIPLDRWNIDYEWKVTRCGLGKQTGTTLKVSTCQAMKLRFYIVDSEKLQKFTFLRNLRAGGG